MTMNVRWSVRLLFVALSITAGLACNKKQAANPLGPSDPTGGVTINAPRPVLPETGVTVTQGNEPLTLVVENAVTNSPRALTYTFEGSTESSFTGDVFRAAGIAAGAEGRTSVNVPATLPPGRTYYWRAQATDGVVTSAYSAVAHFTVAQRFRLDAPEPVSPGDGAAIDTREPALRTRNAAQSGPPEPVDYRFEVAPSPDFATLSDSGIVAEQPGETEFRTRELQAATTYYWRVRGEARTVTSDWSAVRSFTTAPGGAGGGVPTSPPGPRPGAAEGVAMVQAVLDDMQRRGISAQGDCGAFDVVRRVAWAFRNRGAGLEAKPAGRNCQGHSIDIVMFTDGMTVDILVGAGVDNQPTWLEHGPFPELLGDWRAPVNPD
jgi:hypothetical protein